MKRKGKRTRMQNADLSPVTGSGQRLNGSSIGHPSRQRNRRVAAQKRDPLSALWSCGRSRRSPLSRYQRRSVRRRALVARRARHPSPAVRRRGRKIPAGRRWRCRCWRWECGGQIFFSWKRDGEVSVEIRERFIYFMCKWWSQTHPGSLQHEERWVFSTRQAHPLTQCSRAENAQQIIRENWGKICRLLSWWLSLSLQNY